MAKKNDRGKWDLEPQKSSAAQFLTYIAANGAGGEKYEIRYEDETIWMSQKMLAAVYGVDLRTVSYHITKIFKDAELGALAAKGLSGSVYTQTADMEVETNGLLTYDRKVLKFNPAVLKAAHERVKAAAMP